jgi:hypothetical protein
MPFNYPTEVDDVTLAFPAQIRHLKPTWEEIPAEFKRHDGTPWNTLFNKWFYSGLDATSLQEKPGIAKGTALRHVRAIAGSYEPKHEHKEAAVAYLMSLWFEESSVKKVLAHK